ncbi:MAG: hypothetical protein ACOCYE_00180 [Pseudomonadota bacterium]
MRISFVALGLGLLGTAAFAAPQQPVGRFGPVDEAALPFSIEFREVTSPKDAPPALHSFVEAVAADGTWLLLSGRGAPAARIDDVEQSGLHGFNPPESGRHNFPLASYNTGMWTFHPTTGEVAVLDIETLPPAIRYPLRTTSQQAWYDRASDQLTIVGGYGWNTEEKDLQTFDTMIRVEVEPLIEAIRTGQPAGDLFEVLRHPQLQVTGGDLVQIADDAFYLVFGHTFTGSYFAFGSALPAGTTQVYTQEIRRIEMVPGRFEILSVAPLPVLDRVEYNRRDLNVRMTRDAPSGEPRVGVYGGVFKKGGPGGFDHPILVDPASDEATIERGGSQLFNAYATPVIPVWSETAGVMAQVFFGGIGHGVHHICNDPPQEIGLDNDGMPFGCDVSVLTHDRQGNWREYVLPEPVPGRQLLATNGAFLLQPALHDQGRIVDQEIIRLDRLPEGEAVLVGHVFGGILAQMPQPPKGPPPGADEGQERQVPTSATNKLFEVYLTRTAGAAIPVLGR